MLECVWNVFRFDFRDDLELRMNLARHLVPLEVRLSYDMNLKNPLLNDIQTRYPLAYSMAADAGAVIAERFGTKLSDDETGYIALTFALALERRKTQVPKKHVLVVCASGAGSARLLECRCRQEFGSYIGSIESCDVLNLSKVDFSNVDYVFTTVPLPQKLPVPVCEVQHFLDENEILNVRDFLRAAQREEGSILRYFDRALFFPHLPFRTKREALDYLLDRVAEQREVSEAFREAVWEREATVATSFGNNVAMPHPLAASSSETFVCVGLLDHPVVWDELGRTVQAVFLSFFSTQSGPELQAFYGKLADLLVSKEAICSLLANQSWEMLANLLAFAPSDMPDTSGGPSQPAHSIPVDRDEQQGR